MFIYNEAIGYTVMQGELRANASPRKEKYPLRS
jgi:hypothetical protein